MSFIFIAHVEEDADVALEIALGLEEAGYGTWCYEVDSVPGTSYIIRTGEAVAQSQAVVVIISPHSLGSGQVTKEVVRAHESNKHFIPVLRNITHAEFQQRQPEWREAIGSATSIRIPRRGTTDIMPLIIEGAKSLGLKAVTRVNQPRIELIRRSREEYAMPSKIEQKPIATATAPGEIKKHKIRKPLIMASGALAVTVMVVLAILLPGLLGNGEPSTTPTQTSTPEVSPTPTSVTSAITTLTPTPPSLTSVTATLTPTPSSLTSATATLTPTPSPTTTASPTPGLLPMLEEDFSDTTSGWPYNIVPEYERFYENGEYHIRVKAGWAIWAYKVWRGMLTDFTAETDARLISESTQNHYYGLVFRFVDEKNFYAFKITKEGGYYISKYANGIWTFLANDKRSDIISKDNVDHLKIECKGSLIKAYANGILVATVTDTTFNMGYVGVFAEATATDGHAHFDNFKIYDVE
jgi:hypothetical protein